GRIYIGKIDTDPTIPENQIQVYMERENGDLIPAPQPIIINAAGYPVYAGQIAKFVTVEGHSMAVYDSYGGQQFYYPNVLKYNPDRLRQELEGNDGALLIGTRSGKKLQQEIDDINKYDKTLLFSTQKEAKNYDGVNAIRVMGWKNFGDDGAGIFIKDSQKYETPDGIDRFKNDVTGDYWIRILSDADDAYIGTKNNAIIRANEKKNNSPWGQLSPINILGDSITYGYFASYDGSQGAAKSYGGGQYYHNWTSIFARMMAADNGSGCYKGFIPLPSGYGNDWDVFSLVSQTGNWSIADTGSYAENLYGGGCYLTDGNNSSLEYNIPATFNEIQLYYCLQPGGGAITATLNGKVWQVIATQSNSVSTGSIRVASNSNHQGNTILKISCSGLVGVCGIGVDNVMTLSSATPRGGSINQFATPGRTLSSVGENVIADCTKNASALILALGFNDGNINKDNHPDARKRPDFSERINWIVRYCNQNDCPLIVIDMSWSWQRSSFTRRELRRAAREADGIYIPLPDLIIKGRLSTPEERTLRLKLWFDGAHPNRNGHQWIAETLAKYIGLSCSSKKDAIMNHDYWISIDLRDEWANTRLEYFNLSAYKIHGNGISIRASITRTDEGIIPTGEWFVAKSDSIWRNHIKPPIDLNPYPLVMEFERDVTSVNVSTVASINSTGRYSLIRHDGKISRSMVGANIFAISRYDS
ncbi:phage tailspike protein, partial [Xenorhabdus bovienii]|uniref:phage tailspike protein n=1 Tax=Xenorhabdus bovienii TaxID=40576 RepID=UPI00237CBD5E